MKTTNRESEAVEIGQFYPIDPSKLPKTWKLTYVGNEVASIQPGYANGIHNKDGHGIPHLRPMNISRKGEIDLSVVKYVQGGNFELLEAGDVLFNNTNSPDLIGKTSYVLVSQGWAFSNHMTRLRVGQSLVPKFLALQLHFLWMSGYFKHRCVKHVNQASISSAALKKLPLVVAPIDKQREIVAEIEKQFTRLDAGVAALKRVQANLKRYRASVLKAACEGKLVPTEAALARAEGRSYEPASVLLQRILEERRKNWSGRGKYKDPLPPDTTNLPPLPEGWCWASLEQVQTFMRNGITAKPAADHGLPILRISAVRPLQVDLSDVRFLDPRQEDFSSYAISEGDLLFTRYNGNSEFVGACAVVPKIDRFIVHPDKLIRCRLSDSVNRWFIGTVVNVGASRAFLSLRIRTTAGQSGISGTDLKSLPIPLPPFYEQKRIMVEVDGQVSAIKSIESMLLMNSLKGDLIRRLILENSFKKKVIYGV